MKKGQPAKDEIDALIPFFKLGFSGFTLSVFIARTSLTCPGATWVRERQWVR